MKRKLKEKSAVTVSDEQKREEAALFIEKRLRGILARKRVREIRQEEMVFLGMARKPKTLEEQRNDPIEKTKVIEGERKEV